MTGEVRSEPPVGDESAGASTTSPETPEAMRSRRMIEVLRIGLGVVWVANLGFIVYPPNNFFGDFSATALTFAPVSFGGPGFPDYVAAHPLFFSWLVALITGYLAVAFTLGLTTKVACFVGSFFSAVLFAIQIGTIFVAPGGTDVGEHPLFILISAVLLVGGAGSTLSLDAVVEKRWAEYRAAHPVAVRRPVPSGWTTPLTLSSRTLFVYFVAGTLVSLGVGIGLTVAFPLQSSSSAPPAIGPTTYENLSVNVAPNGWPQYTPSNFTIHTGLVVITIVDNDSSMNWSGCPCPVTGTVGGVEKINGTPLHIVPSDNVAHSFNVPALNLAVYSPGGATVQFSVDVTRTGELVWVCVVPCGTGADPYSTPPMGVPGFMTGTITVV